MNKGITEIILEEPGEIIESSKEAGVVVGWIAKVDDSGEPFVGFPNCPEPDGIKARSIVPVTNEHVGREAILQFEAGDTSRPIIMGFIWTPQSPPSPESAGSNRLVLEAKDSIVLQCGSASLTLTRSGKILIRGEYVLTRSSGVNRIQGASVQIN
jgi:uncharacterized protein DUF6484